MPSAIYVDDSGSMLSDWKQRRIAQLFREERAEGEVHAFRVAMDIVRPWDEPYVGGGAPSIDTILDHAYELSIPFLTKIFVTDERPSEDGMEQLLKNNFEVAVIVAEDDPNGMEWSDPSSLPPPERIEAPVGSFFTIEDPNPYVTYQGSGTTTGNISMTFSVAFDEITQALDNITRASQSVEEQVNTATAFDPIGPADPEFERLLAEEDRIEREGSAASALLGVSDPNRRIHAYDSEVEVVRYDRTSKWYIEPRGQEPRHRVTIDEAVQVATECYAHPQGGVVFEVPGGSSFDRRMRQALVDEGLVPEGEDA